MAWIHSTLFNPLNPDYTKTYAWRRLLSQPIQPPSHAFSVALHTDLLEHMHRMLGEGCLLRLSIRLARSAKGSSGAQVRLPRRDARPGHGTIRCRDLVARSCRPPAEMLRRRQWESYLKLAWRSREMDWCHYQGATQR